MHHHTTTQPAGMMTSQQEKEGRAALYVDTDQKNYVADGATCEDLPTASLTAREFIFKKGFDFTYDDLDERGRSRASRLMSNDYCWTPTKFDATEEQPKRGETSFRREFEYFKKKRQVVAAIGSRVQGHVFLIALSRLQDG
jgi:hypothetical protein